MGAVTGGLGYLIVVALIIIISAMGFVSGVSSDIMDGANALTILIPIVFIMLFLGAINGSKKEDEEQ